MAAPQFGSMTFIGLQTGNTYNVDIYLSDVDNALIRWDNGAGASATSSDFWTAPEAVALVDYAQVTGTTDTEKLQLTVNNNPTGHMLRYTIHLTSLSKRAPIAIKFARNAQIRALQRAD